MKIYKFNEWLLLAICLIVFGFSPAMSIVDLASGGSARDLWQVEGYIKLPYWLEEAISWLGFIIFFKIFIGPSLKYVARGYVFKLDEDRINLGTGWVELDSLVSANQSLWAGIKLKDSRGRAHLIRPGLSAGWPDFAEFLSRSRSITLVNLDLDT